MSKRTDGKTAHQVAQEAMELRKDTEAVAVDAVNPGSGHRENVPADEPEEVQYQLDPQMVAQASANKHARLIAMMVNENAMLEVALEQERRAHGETRAKLAALQQAFTADED